MPRATAQEVKERVELKTCPEGYVVLRKFTYGENLRRREIGASVGRRGRSNADEDLEMRVNVTALQAYEFGTAIIDHNLEDETGRTLNFSDRKDLVSLDPDVAAEIEEAIDKLNRPGEEPTGDPFKSRPGSQSSTESPSTPG